MVLVSTPTAPGAARAGDRDCSDFTNQAQAQHYFENHNPQQDPDQLDGDGNGVACESLPCPCAGHGNPGPGGSDHGHVRRTRAIVDHVADGDTIAVRLRGKVHDVRLIGIDTPESVRPGVPVECGALAASREMHRMLRPGERVKLISDPSQDDRDQYRRLLRYVEQGGRDIGRRQIHKGNAAVYVFGGVPFTRVHSYRRAQRNARHHDRGVWGLCGGDFHTPAKTPNRRH